EFESRRVGKRSQSGEQVKRRAVGVLQRHVLPVESHEKMRARGPDGGDTPSMRVATIADDQLAGTEREPRERFATRGVGELDVIDGEPAQIEADVKAPVGAFTSGRADGGGVDESQPQLAAVVRGWGRQLC